MEKFENKSNLSNEKAIRKGKVVPTNAVPLAYVSGPELNPEDNLSIIDTSGLYSENSIDAGLDRKLMYANFKGILEDFNGNELVDDQYPIVSDIFAVDEDFSMSPVIKEGDSEYDRNSILGFVHKSRYFHIDYAGLTLGTEILTYPTEAIKVINSRGDDYVDINGRKRYRIAITPAAISLVDNQTEALYRVHAYIDDDSNEDLYIQYNMVEVDETGVIVNQRPDHREILNPLKYFSYTPEESMVTDPQNIKLKQYSTQLIDKKQELMGKTTQSADGYRVFVPKKAVPDTREFQLFRWRVGCTFTEGYKVDPAQPRVIRAGVVVTNNRPTSNCPYVFYNLMKSKYNPAGVRFINPLKSGIYDTPPSDTEMRKASYWQVNFDTITEDQLKQFDILIWSVQVHNYNMSPYFPKILHYTGNLGGTMFFDSNNTGRILGLQTVPTYAVDPGTASPKVKPAGIYDGMFGRGRSMRFPIQSDPLIMGETKLGGWNLIDNQGNAELYTISPYNRLPSAGGPGKGFVQRIHSRESHWWSVIDARDENNLYKPLVQRCKANSGNMIYSTIGMPDNVNSLFDASNGKKLTYNTGATADSRSNYNDLLNSHIVEGMYKFMFNVCLLAVVGRPLDSSDEIAYSTSWNKYTPWEGSWVINPSDGVLTQAEMGAHNFTRLPETAANPAPVWKRKLSGKTLKTLIDESLTEDEKRKVQGSPRSYFMEVTNENVLINDSGELNADNTPVAWTNLVSPPFDIPPELGPHIIKEDNVIGDYTAGNYIHKSYPAKKYGLLVNAQNVVTEQHHNVKAGTLTAQVTLKIRQTTGASSTESILNWVEDGSGSMVPSSRPWEKGLQVPGTMVTWQDGNYYSSKWGPGNLNWPHWGMTQRLAKGSRGEVVGFLHNFLNNYQGAGFDANDTTFGSKTESVIKGFQQAHGARFIDGIVDAETWFLIGNQILRRFSGITVPNAGQYLKYYRKAIQYIAKANISNGSSLDGFMKRSSTLSSPPVIWEMFKIELNDTYPIHGITLTPWTEGNTNTIMWRSIDVRNGSVLMKDYDSQSGKLTYMPLRPRNGVPMYRSFGPYNGKTVIIGVGQDGPSGFGKSRILGVRDIQIHAKGTKGNGQVSIITKTLTVTKSFSFGKTGKQYHTLNHGYKGPGVVVDQTWGAMSTNNPDITPVMVDAKKGEVYLTSFVIDNNQSNESNYGPTIPTAAKFYSMNENKVLNPGFETGYISKSDGIKLLCTSDKQPYGFPTLVAGTGPHERQIHYTSLIIEPTVMDPSIEYGFYDVVAKEMIQNRNGQAEMSYLEYRKRGPQNVFVAMISHYEMVEDKPLPPPSSSTPKVPYKWAMPVYGLGFRKGASIQIEKPSKSLDAFSMWSLPIRTGSFIRKLTLPKRNEQIMTGLYAAYQGATLEAYYDIPEADRTSWSELHGRPYQDIKDETPELLDDRTLRLRQVPVHAVNAPTVFPSPADPLRPMIRVWTRESVVDEWTEVGLTGISDYNLSDGTVILRERLVNMDPNLVKVSYTTSRPVYYYKGTSSEPLILNPYLSESYNILEKPIYIGIEPRFVKEIAIRENSEDSGVVIPESIKTNTLSWTLDINSKLDPTSPDYSPFYVQLGVIYISPNANLSRLSIIDARRRGGGARTDDTLEKLSKTVIESKYYWDLNHAYGMPYQSSGFVIIRLPESLTSRFSKAEIHEVVAHNITAGVEFKLETLSGEEWPEDE